MAKPSSLPRWATGGAVTPEPTEGKKTLGWEPGEKPPAQYVNWAQNLVYQWCVYLDGITNEALVWASRHTFSAGLASSVAPSAATDVVRKTELDTKAADSAVVHLAGAESVGGVKTFSSSPVVPTPVASGEAASKGYVDGKFPAISWTGPSLASGWINGGGVGGNWNVGYWKDACGVVHIKGRAQWNSGSTSPFALPAGYRPLETRTFPSGGPGVINVAADGTVTCYSLSVGSYAWFDSISFVAEQ